MEKKVGFLTLGCKVNSYETDAMVKLFEKEGYKVVPFSKEADIYIVNTCTVTNVADRKSRQMLHKARRMNENAIVVAVGCYVQAAKEVLLGDELIDIVIGNNQKKKIVKIVEDYINGNKNRDNVVDMNKDQIYENLEIVSTLENARAYIKIQDGCNQFCSYCIIPYVRGRIRSRSIEDVLKEVEKVAKNEYKEVVLTGIHISSYGMDFENSSKFEYKYLIELIEKISNVTGIERIRLGSLEPRIITTEFIEKLSKFKKVCPHFHLSLQSGCDKILKRMNRKYTTDIFIESCNIIRKYFDNPAITTDVIVGFPSETDEDFEETRLFLEKVNFSKMHIFKYSRRKGTVADKMDNQVDEKIKSKRSKVLLEMTNIQHKEYMNKFLNKNELVLFEEETNIDGERYIVGHNERYIKIAVKFGDGNILLHGMLRRVVTFRALNEDIIEAKFE